MKAKQRPRPSGPTRRVTAVALIVALQMVATIFFLADALGDVAQDGLGPHVVIELGIALALFTGVVFGARQLQAMVGEARRKDRALAIAAGALNAIITQRFREWRLTPAEADVALFTLKGCEVPDIAAMRGAAEGTVRAQLTHVYAKAGVTSRAALLSLFFDELLQAPLHDPHAADGEPA